MQVQKDRLDYTGPTDMLGHGEKLHNPYPFNKILYSNNVCPSVFLYIYCTNLQVLL
jgi:hypothetical protein